MLSIENLINLMDQKNDVRRKIEFNLHKRPGYVQVNVTFDDGETATTYVTLTDCEAINIQLLEQRVNFTTDTGAPNSFPLLLGIKWFVEHGRKSDAEIIRDYFTDKRAGREPVATSRSQ